MKAGSYRLAKQHVLAVMGNEWAQLIRNRVVVYTTLVPTVLLVILAIAVLGMSAFLTEGSGAAQMLQKIGVDGAVFSGSDNLRVSLLNPFLVLFQVIPLVVPITIASYSIVGEKQLRTLEPLLATPIKTWELLAAKGWPRRYLAYLLPGGASPSSRWRARFIGPDYVFSNLLLSRPG